VNRTSPLTGLTGTITGRIGDTQSPEMARNHLKILQMHSVGQNKLKLLPLIDNASIKPKLKNFQPRASQIDKIQHSMLHTSKWASEILYSFVWTKTTRSPCFTIIGQS
jgi:hypothetical protein